MLHQGAEALIFREKSRIFSSRRSPLSLNWCCWFSFFFALKYLLSF